MLKRMICLLFLLSMAPVLGACRQASTGRLAIYLLAQDIAPHDVAQMDLGSLVLQDQPLLSSDDFTTYRADTHEISLQPSTCGRLRQAFPKVISVSGVPFVVCVGTERIYAGAFWTPLSSLSFDGVVIQQPCMMQEQTLRIELGYPSGAFFTGPDPRSDSRIMGALRNAGKLK